ncbi:MAG: amino acid ABC transporter permease [Oscillospiraceae bacterium]|nr:amino acid ABC transporter permease [Oscillospiraceae bacterium]
MMENIIKILEKYGMVFVQGLGGTLWISLVTVVFGTILGTLIALLKLSKVKVLNWVVDVYVEIIRGTPVLLQLYFFWIGLPRLLPMLTLSDTECVVVALIFNASAYIAEVIRAGIQAVDPGQTEAAKSLGMSDAHTMTRIVLPQAIKNILPALGNEFITMIKQSSLASVFFVNELTTSFKVVQSATFLAIPPLIISGMIYLVLNWSLSRLIGLLERRLHSND